MRQGLIYSVALLFMLTAIPAYAGVKIAYVDIQRALNECTAGKAAKSKIRAQAERAQAKLKREQKEVRALKDELDKKGMLMSPDQRENLQDRFTRKMRDFRDDVKNERDELHQKDNELTGAIVGDLVAVVHRLGEKDGYTVVFEKSGLLWAVPSADITEEVVRTYDGMHVKPGSLAQSAGAGSGVRGGRPHLGSSLRKRSTISK